MMVTFSAMRTVMRPLSNTSRMRTPRRFFSTAPPPQERSTVGRYVGAFLLGLTAGGVYTGYRMDNDVEFRDNVEERFPGSISLLQSITGTDYNSINREPSVENDTNLNESNDITVVNESPKQAKKRWLLYDPSVYGDVSGDSTEQNTHEDLDEMLAKMLDSMAEKERDELMTKIFSKALSIVDSQKRGQTDDSITTAAFYEAVQDALGLTSNDTPKPSNIPVITKEDAYVNALEEVWNGWGGGSSKTKTKPNFTTSGWLGKDIDGEQITTNAQSFTDESMKEFSNTPKTEVKSESKPSESNSNDKEKKTEWLLYDPKVCYKQKVKPVSQSSSSSSSSDKVLSEIKALRKDIGERCEPKEKEWPVPIVDDSESDTAVPIVGEVGEVGEAVKSAVDEFSKSLDKIIDASLQETEQESGDFTTNKTVLTALFGKPGAKPSSSEEYPLYHPKVYYKPKDMQTASPEAKKTDEVLAELQALRRDIDEKCS